MPNFNIPGLGLDAVDQPSTVKSLTVQNGLTVSAGGITVTAGGITVQAGNVVLQNTAQFYAGKNAGGSVKTLIGVNASGTNGFCQIGDTATLDGIMFMPGAPEAGRMTPGGVFAWGTTVTTGAAAGNIVLPNSRALCAVDIGGTSTVPMIYLDANGVVQVGQTSRPLAITHSNLSTDFGGTIASQKGLIHAPTDLAGTVVFYDGATGARYKLVGTAF